jgi:3-oxoacyl-[acyl-carrier-protein] synthase-3
LSDAGVDVGEVDLVICATVTPDTRFPATACAIQAALGIAAPAYDLNAGCSGWLYALAQADACVRSGSASCVLVVGTDVLSRLTDYTDPKTAILFGDGAGTAIVRRTEAATRVGPFELFADGSRPELLYVSNDTGLIHMEGREVYRAAVDSMAKSVGTLLEHCGTAAADIDLLIAHQANQRILDAVARRLGIEESVAFSNIARYGNTSAASIPIAMIEARDQGRLTEDALVVLAAFGAGFTWGAGLVRWGTGPLHATTKVSAGAVDV